MQKINQVIMPNNLQNNGLFDIQNSNLLFPNQNKKFNQINIKTQQSNNNQNPSQNMNNINLIMNQNLRNLNPRHNNNTFNNNTNFNELKFNSINIRRNIKQNNQNDLSDSQIDLLFSQLNNMKKDGNLLLYIINKKGIPYFISLTKTIKGSKYLQNILSANPPKKQEIDLITKIICFNYKEIMCDYYGNYFLQKFFPFCDAKNRLDILNSLKNDYIQIANDICGNHSLQCLISSQMSNEEKEIIKLCTMNNLKELCFGVNSSHVISKIIKCIKESERQYINTFMINNIKSLCIDRNGICIMKEFIINIKSNFYIKLIISNFEKDIMNLTLNQYGNYIIQETIKFLGYNYCKNIINSLIKNIVKLSISKFSSNVIDFLLEYLSKKEFHQFCVAIKRIFLKESNFKEMIKHKFSIYVIENSLELLININENYYITSMKNNLGNSFNSKKSSSLHNSSNDKDESDSKDNENLDEQDKEISYQNFCKLRKKIFQFIENNSVAKEKKKILALIKVNKYNNI